MWRSFLEAKSCHCNLQMRKSSFKSWKRIMQREANFNWPVVQSQPWDLQPWRIHLCRKMFAIPGQVWRVQGGNEPIFSSLQDLQDAQDRVHLAEGRHGRFWRVQNWHGHTVWFAMIAKPSKALVPCGHACVWGPCFHWMQPWDMKGRGPKHWRTVLHRSNNAICWVD